MGAYADDTGLLMKAAASTGADGRAGYDPMPLTALLTTPVTGRGGGGGTDGGGGAYEFGAAGRGGGGGTPIGMPYCVCGGGGGPPSSLRSESSPR